MTIKELEAEVAATEKRVRDAEADRQLARDRLQAAINDASGIVGHVLEFTRSRGFRPRTIVTYRIRVDNVKKHWSGAMHAFGHRIRNDGTVGFQTTSTPISEATDLGPYVAPSATQDAIITTIMDRKTL